MTPEEAIEIIHEKHMDMEYYFAEHDRYPKYYDFEFDQATLIAAQALKEIQQYREMDRKLREAYGDCDGLLERSVDLLCEHAGIDIGDPIKARLLTDENVDKWDAYREIGTVEECREAVEKQRPKKPVLRNDNGKLRKSCPVCGCFFSPLSRSCPKCGQAILQENKDD